VLREEGATTCPIDSNEIKAVIQMVTMEEDLP
jgi:hypothetical protein